MDTAAEELLSASFLPVCALVRSVLYSDYERKNMRFTKTQITVLALLYWQGDMCMSEIADLALAPRPQMTRVVDPLAEEGFVERFSDETDRKRVRIRLTEQGRSYIREFLQLRLRTLKEKLTMQEEERLSEATNTIVSILGRDYAR